MAEFAGDAMQIDAPVLGELLQTFGTEIAADFPVHLGGPFEKNGDHWQISDGKGTLAASAWGAEKSIKTSPSSPSIR